ncbi:MAG: 2'-5' RNA ligase family protein [Anaerolineae bacterium]|nr:2'-5' RNA ligase family protein [Anaerolineae bacterium]
MFELTTSIVIVAPHPVQAIAMPIMRQYAPESLIRFRPHITLLFPFVPFQRIQAACDRLYPLCAGIAPFEITLEGYDEFPGVIYMKPADPEPIRAVFRTIHQAFPDYPPYEGKFGDDSIEPHMTVATFDSIHEQPVVPLPNYPPITFRVDRLHLWYGVRDADLPWLTYDVIPLRG